MISPGACQEPRVFITVPVTEDAAHLWETWLAWGGKGIVLKDPASIYRPGERRGKDGEDGNQRTRRLMVGSAPAGRRSGR